MKYRKDKYGNEISVLGYGCMRFTKKGTKLIYEKAEKEILEAYNNGINYYDTAYVYSGSEELLGRVLEENKIRDKVYIATKLPHYMIKTIEEAEKIFNEELERLRTDHIDYYLMHMLTDIKSWERLVDMGIIKWLEKKKKEGKIKQIGFSYHGNSDMFCKIIDSYNWDICLIQYNYLDENSQAGKTGLHYAASKGIPVNIMEPLRGGRLVNGLPEKAKKLFSNYPKKMTPVEWSFKWLWNQKEVLCVLSGMNSIEMVKANTGYANEAKVNSFTKEDLELLDKVVEAINEKMKVPCTGCRYCMPCPRGVDIPGCFSAYNDSSSDNLYTGLKEYIMCMVLRNNYTGVSNCIGCGKCEQHCPQHIEIRRQLKSVKRKFENPPLKLVIKILPKIAKY